MRNEMHSLEIPEFWWWTLPENVQNCICPHQPDPPDRLYQAEMIRRDPFLMTRWPLTMEVPRGQW